MALFLGQDSTPPVFQAYLSPERSTNVCLWKGERMRQFLWAVVGTVAVSAFFFGVIYAFVFGTAHDLARDTTEKKWIRIRNFGIGLWVTATVYVFYLLARDERPSWLWWLFEGS